MRSARRQAVASRPFRLVGGDATLDFNNTASWHENGVHGYELLGRFEDLAAWARAAYIVDAPGEHRLLAQAKRDPGSATAALTRAHALRETLHGVFASLAANGNVSARDLTAFNAALRVASERLSVIRTSNIFEWHLPVDDVDCVFRHVIWSAARLITSPEVKRLNLCAGLNCGWLFLDSSKNGSRRWCSMDQCGGRAKAQAYQERIAKTGA